MTAQTEKLRALVEERLRYLERFSDDGQHRRIPGPSAGDAYEIAQDIRAAIAALSASPAEGAQSELTAERAAHDATKGEVERLKAKYEYALLLIALSQSDEEGMGGVAYTNQVPLDHLDKDWAELARLMTDNAVDVQGWRPKSADELRGLMGGCEGES